MFMLRVKISQHEIAADKIQKKLQFEEHSKIKAGVSVHWPATQIGQGAASAANFSTLLNLNPYFPTHCESL